MHVELMYSSMFFLLVLLTGADSVMDRRGVRVFGRVLIWVTQTFLLTNLLSRLVLVSLLKWTGQVPNTFNMYISHCNVQFSQSQLVFALFYGISSIFSNPPLNYNILRGFCPRILHCGNHRALNVAQRFGKGHLVVGHHSRQEICMLQTIYK